MIVNCGHKEYGYTRILENYITNAEKYEGIHIEENKEIAKSVLSNTFTAIRNNLPAIATGVTGTLIMIGLMCPDATFASTGGSIDLSPLDKFFKEVYWTMFKVLMYITTPIWAWVGYILATGSSNNEKRTLAKKVGTGVIVGTGFVAGAPWATRALFGLWRIVFA